MSIVAGTPTDSSIKLNLKTNFHLRPLVDVVWRDCAGGEWVEYQNFIDDADIDENTVTSGFWYRGELYSLSEFTVAGNGVKAMGFDGVQAESAFSAVIVRYFDSEGYDLTQDDSIIVGYLHW